MARPVTAAIPYTQTVLDFSADISDVLDELPDWAVRRVPSITRNAINDTAFEARQAEMDTISTVFDRPTRFTLQSVLVDRATSAHLEAQVYIRYEPGRGTAPDRYLRPQIEGGPRRHKRFELALIRRGIMAAHEYAVPAAGMPLDAYGNIPGSVIVQILSHLQAFAEVGFSANRTARSAKRKATGWEYFVPELTWAQDRGIERALPRGIYRRRGRSRPLMVLMFVRQPHYAVRYPFGRATRRVAESGFWRNWERHFYAELAKRTARAST